MRHIIFKSRAALALVLLAMLATSEVYAIDSNNRYFAFGLGQRNL